MRRAIITAVIAFTLLLLTMPSTASGWFFHHHKRYLAGYGRPVAAPLTLGFQFPWGGQVTTQFDLQHFLQQRREGQTPDTKGPARVTVTEAVAKKIAEIETDVNKGVDKLNALLDTLNKDREDVEKDLKKIDPKHKTIRDQDFAPIVKTGKADGKDVSTGKGTGTVTQKGPTGK